MKSAMTMLAASCLPAIASPTHYFDSDRVSTPSVAGATGPLGKETDWLTALAGETVRSNDFESLPQGRSPALTLAPGVTMTTTFDSWFEVSDRRWPHPSDRHGFNTTPGGSNHAVWHGIGWHLVVIEFQKPIQAFSCWITGTGFPSWPDDNITHEIDWDGTGSGGFSFGVPNPPELENVFFTGFNDPSARSIRVNMLLRYKSIPGTSSGSYSFDDIRWVEAPVPTPASAALLALVACLRLRR
jgi:hypothetical protein